MNQEILAAPENIRNGKLSDFIYWQECIGDQFEGCHGFLDELLVSADGHPSNLHARQRKHLGKSVQREYQRRVCRGQAGECVRSKQELAEYLIGTDRKRMAPGDLGQSS